MELRILNDINDDIIRLRTDTFVVGRNVPYDVDFDGRDSELMHFCLYDGETLIAYLRAEDMDGYMHIGRVCVLKSVRKMGYGSVLMNHFFEYAKKSDMARVELSAVNTAVPFYEKLGFEKHGDFHMEAGAPHVKMTKEF